ncbi:MULTISPECIES: alpha/beta hydrolase fold domain-containing protein [unclassified Mycolicibacterium]|uniref:alpha/beta hydrolase fold domain-containing protein n=1 Tax=unclassified Mycolicibacterium TaxID=2636767 RepID=UPI0035CBAE8A
MFCDLDTHDDLCRSLSNGIGAVVVSVAYRLAPESRWPAPADDVYAALCWAARTADELGGDVTVTIPMPHNFARPCPAFRRQW